VGGVEGDGDVAEGVDGGEVGGGPGAVGDGSARPLGGVGPVVCAGSGAGPGAVGGASGGRVEGSDRGRGGEGDYGRPVERPASVGGLDRAEKTSVVTHDSDLHRMNGDEIRRLTCRKVAPVGCNPSIWEFKIVAR
jgi:hypothetical protein